MDCLCAHTTLEVDAIVALKLGEQTSSEMSSGLRPCELPSRKPHDEVAFFLVLFFLKISDACTNLVLRKRLKIAKLIILWLALPRRRAPDVTLCVKLSRFAASSSRRSFTSASRASVSTLVIT